MITYHLKLCKCLMKYLFVEEYPLISIYFCMYYSQNIVWHGFGESCTGKVVQRTATSSRCSGVPLLLLSNFQHVRNFLLPSMKVLRFQLKVILSICYRTSICYLQNAGSGRKSPQEVGQ